MKRFVITFFRMIELFFTFDHIAVHLRNNIKKEDNNISNGNTIWATRATNTLLCRDGIRAIVVGQVVATDMLASTYRLVWTRSVILHAIFHSMLSGRHCAGIVGGMSASVEAAIVHKNVVYFIIMHKKNAYFTFFPSRRVLPRHSRTWKRYHSRILWSWVGWPSLGKTPSEKLSIFYCLYFVENFLFYLKCSYFFSKWVLQRHRRTWKLYHSRISWS